MWLYIYGFSHGKFTGAVSGVEAEDDDKGY